MKFEVLKKANQIILISREDNIKFPKYNDLGAIIINKEDWSFPKNESLKMFNDPYLKKKYDSSIVKQMISAYISSIPIKSLGYNKNTIKKYELFLYENNIIDKEKNITAKGKLLDFVLKKSPSKEEVFELSL